MEFLRLFLFASFYAMLRNANDDKNENDELKLCNEECLECMLHKFCATY